MVDRVLVAFEGIGAGTEELTWGQIGLWQGVEDTGVSPTMGGVTALPPGVRVDDVMATMRYAASRHQSLRTRLRFGPGRPKQVCVERGELPLLIEDIGPDEDAAAVAEAVRKDFEVRDWDYENEFPLRAAVIRHAGVPSHMVAVYSHLAIDANAFTLLMEEIATRDPAAPIAPVTATEPLEQARQQGLPAARRASAASLRYLESVLRTVPASRFGPPRYPRTDPPYRLMYYTSAATELAVRRVAAEQNVDTSTVLLAAYAIGLARFTGNGQVLAMLLVGNRFRPGFAATISPVVQMSPYFVDVSGVSLRGALDRARIGVLNTYKNAYYDPYAQDEVLARVDRERGEPVDNASSYNDRRQGDRSVGAGPVPTDAEIRAAVPLGRHVWAHKADVSTRKLYVNVGDVPGALEFEISADVRYFSAADMVALAAGIEAAAVDTALQPDAPTGVRSVNVGESTGS